MDKFTLQQQWKCAILPPEEDEIVNLRKYSADPVILLEQGKAIMTSSVG